MLKNYESKVFRVLKLPGEFTTQESRGLVNNINRMTAESAKPILIDCGSADNVDSQGIGAIVQGFKICKGQKIYFGLLRPRGVLKDLLEITGLNKILNILTELPEASSPEWDKVMERAQQADLKFSFEIGEPDGMQKLVCSGIMHECHGFNRFMYQLENTEASLLDFEDLGFINISCMERFRNICKKKRLSIINANRIVEEELRIFQIPYHLETGEFKTSQAVPT